jgi:glycosyltransferase involved in cell wall biosynthesis
MTRLPILVRQAHKDPPRVLVVTYGPILEPQGGWGVRARSIVDALAGLGVRVSVISHDEPIGSLPPSIDTIHVLTRPLRFSFSFELAHAAYIAAQQADIVIVESALLLPAVVIGRPNAPIVWDTNECETLHYSRMEPTFNNRVRRFVWRSIERWAVRRTDVVVAISETEARWWSQLFPASRNKVAVVDHLVCARPIPYAEARARLDNLCQVQLRGLVLLFVGNLAAKHNSAAAEWLVDSLAPRLPAECSLVLAGPGTEALDARAGTVARLVFLGGVSDIDAVIGGADACLAPLAAGAGVKTKVLHYLAHGKMVLATPVAMEGLEGAPGVRTADLEGFATCVLEFLSRPEETEAASHRADSQRAWVRTGYAPEKVANQLQNVLNRAGVAW